jgi:NAD(P)-dependent dehydrogenase (short-subunit alcohol dehydrogenase family)
MAYKPFDLSGKVVLVTGGNGGIGLGMALACAEAGADICIWGNNPKKNDEATAKLNATGRKVLTLQCNVADEAEVEKGFARTVEVMGKVDACFANAGVSGSSGKPFTEFDTADWHRVLGVNLHGAMYTLRAAAKHMVERGQGGRLAVTASTAAIMGAPRGEHYAATKGGVIAMMKGLAVELARYKITANSILPGWIVTDMTDKRINGEAFMTKVLPRVPARRWGEGADFGGIAVYLASDASAYHTGDSFVIDGGYTIF